MRKDVRLGLAIGGSAIVIVACSVLFFRNPEPKPVPQASQNPPAAPDVTGISPAGQDPVAGHDAGTAPGAWTGTSAEQGTVSVGPSEFHGTGPAGAGMTGLTGSGAGTALGTGAGDAMAGRTGTGTGTGSSWQDLLEHGGATVTRTSTPGLGTGGASGDIAGGGTATFGGTSRETPTAPVSSAGPKSYTIQSGDTYWTIAQKEYGNGAYYTHVMRANPGIPANRLKAGVKITLPGKSEVVPAGAPAVAGGTPANVDARTQYRVQHGDNLYTICKKLYGKTDKVSKLYQLNKDLIGPNPSALKLNMVLQLPDAPASPEAGTSVGTIQ